MASAITDLIDRVSDNNTGRPIIAKLDAPGKAIAASSLNLVAATNWTTTTAIHFSIYETLTVGSTVVKNASTQTDWKGTLAGVAVGNLTLTGGTDRAYTAGAVVELTPTSRYAKDLYDWAMAGHNQNGTHKAFTESSIVPTAAIQDGAISTVKIADAAITGDKIATYKVSRQNNITNSTVSNARIETGWSYIDADTGVSGVLKERAITFGTAFTTQPIIQITYIGRMTSGTPTLPSDFGAGAEDIILSTKTLTTTGVIVMGYKASGYSAGNRLGFTWTAIGN